MNIQKPNKSNSIQWRSTVARVAKHGLVSALFLCIGTAGLHGSDDADPSEMKNFHVFLLTGQSNMAGRAKIEEQDKEPVEGAFLWNIKERKWESAQPPYNRYSPHAKKPSMQRLNPGPSFIRDYLKANPGVSVGIVCPVRGGTRIEHWKKGEQEPWPLFDTAVEVTNEALLAGGELKGILWHQGEGNSSPERVAKYPEQLKQIVADFRSVFRNPNLPFVFSQIGQFNPDYATFNKMIIKQADAISHTICIVTDGLKNMDKAHFNSVAQRELGQRYAKAMLKLLSTTNN